jgi:tetratricopeptide (TPR) repeat protein
MLVGLGLPVQSLAQSDITPGTAGAYLAAREGGNANDFAASAPYFERLLGDYPDHVPFLESAVANLVAKGSLSDAVTHAARLNQLDPSNHIAALTLMADAFARRDYPEVLQRLDAGSLTIPLIDGPARAWAHMGNGRMAEALDVLGDVASQDGLLPFARYSRALALGLAGDFEGAIAEFDASDDPNGAALSRNGILAHVQLLTQLDDFDTALALMDRAFGPAAADPVILELRQALQAGQPQDFDALGDAADGIAEIMAVTANVFRARANTNDALLYARAAVAINPRLTETWLLIGQALEDIGQPLLAAQAYGQVPAGDSFGMAAAMGRAQTLYATGDTEDALELLAELARAYPNSVAAHQVLGDFLRREERFVEAAEAYDRAVEIAGERGAVRDWVLYFSRAVTRERMGDWPPAEADFRRALDLQPDQPIVLNYLGYSLVERQERLDEALEMIERAVAAQPDNGAIVDSLAWVLFRLGRYDEAVAPMERAAALLPVDPVINDHLGDVYWAVGRYREANFQWRRALSLGEHPDVDRDRLRRKIEVGLDRVLEEEGAPPLRAAP